MSLDCPPAELLLRLSEPDLFDDPQEAREVAERAEGCPDCQAILTQFEVELAPPPLPFDPQELLPDLRALLAERATPAPVSEVEVRLLCGYCKDGLQTSDALYCASCLTPHHGECYAEHGRCVAAGCESRAVVGAQELPAPRGRRLRTLAWTLVGIASAGAVAAWAPSALTPDTSAALASKEAKLLPEASQPPSPPPSSASERELFSRRRYPVADLVKVADAKRPAWETRYRSRLESQQVSLNFPKTPLSEVVGFLRDITGLNLTLAQGLDLEREVSLRLRQVPLTDALNLIAEQGGLRWSLIHGTVYLQPVREGYRSLAPTDWPLEGSAAPSEGASLIAALRESSSVALGESGWEEPAYLRVRNGVLEVTQTPAGHRAVAEFLASQRPGLPPPSLQKAWFAWRPPSGLPPSVVQARLHAAELLGEVSLSVEGTVATGLSRLREISAPPIRVDPQAKELVERTKLSLDLKGVTRRDALNLVCAATPSLVWEVDRLGVLIRPAQALPLEARLERAAKRSESRDSTRAIRRLLQSRPVTLHAKNSPGNEVLDFLRDISGLNFVVAPGARALVQEKVDLDCESMSMRDLLDLWLTPLGLGVDLNQGIVRIVLAGEASEGKSLEAKRAALLAAPLAGKGLRGADLFSLASYLEIGAGVSVHLDPKLVGSRRRVFLPAGVNLAKALELLRLQAGYLSGLTWLPQQDCFVIAIRSGGWSSLLRYQELAATPCPWETPPETVLKTWRDRRGQLLTALTALADSSGEDLEANLKRALEEGASTRRLHDFYVNYGTQRGREARERALNVTLRMAARLLATRVELRSTSLLHRALRAAATGQETTLQKKLEAGLINKEEAALARADFQRESLTKTKDFQLQTARLESQRGALRERLRHVCFLPSQVEAGKALAARLIRGEPYDQVFPKRSALESFRLSGRDRFRDFLRGLDHASASPDEVSLRDLGGLIQPGEQVLSVAGQATPTILHLAEALGPRLRTAKAGSPVELQVVVLKGRVEVPLTVSLERGED